MVRHEHARQLQTPSLSASDHRPSGLVVLPVSPEPAAGRGDAARARRRYLVRDHPPMGAEVRTRVCPAPPRPTDIWHLDEVVVSIAGRKHWSWRAVDQDGYVLDEI